MVVGKVVGTVVATQKNEKLQGSKLLVVCQMDIAMRPTSTYAVAVDSVGAGYGEIVLCVSGSSARLTEVTKSMPVDTAIIAIVDTIEVEGKTTFQKH
ncbi:MAG: EutN/CcmL family microcompartment protein [Candidatus Latescibacterota bacterium]